MTVVEIKCEACGGHGLINVSSPNGVFYGITTFARCDLCDGAGTETPPQDHDKDARRAIEGDIDRE